MVLSIGTYCMVAKRHTCLKIPKRILLSFKPIDYSAVFRKFECEHKMFEVIKCILLTLGLIISFQMERESIARRGQIPPPVPLYCQCTLDHLQLAWVVFSGLMMTQVK